jgi:hypothetical protein
LIINIEFKSKLSGLITIILDQENKKRAEVYGHDKNEWGFKDDSEQIEWEEYYESKSKKWRTEDEI